MPLEGRDKTSHLLEPYQGLGALAVSHMSSRITVAMLPAGRPHMRLDMPAEFLMENQGQVPADVNKGLALSERIVQGEVEDKDWRDATLQSIQQLLVAGNVCEYQFPDNSIRLHRLDRYVVRRDYSGRVLEGIIKESLSPDMVPEEVTAPPSKGEDEHFDLYTWIKPIVLGEKKRPGYEVRQYIDDEQASEPIQYERDFLPYNFLRWTSVPGEDYGRAKFEEHVADFRSLDALEKATLEGAAMASRNFIFIKPGATGHGLRDRITKAANGDVLVGDPEGVELKSFENASGYTLTVQQVQRLEERLGRAWLLLSATQRNAERVTATEIERDIQEIEAALGGNFSTLNVQMMERRTRLLMKNMEDAGRLPNLLANGVRPTILTGLEALSRERDVNRAAQLSQLLQGFGPEALDIVKLEVPLRAATIGLGFADAIRGEKEVAQRQQQRAAMQTAQAVAPQVAGALAKGQTGG
jgi:hypothetical protein